MQFATMSGIPGDSTDKDHPGWIEVPSFHWGWDGALPGVGKSGKVFVSMVDGPHSRPLITRIHTGDEIEGMLLGVPGVRYRFQKVMVHNVEFAGTHNSRAVHQFEFSFKSVHLG
jgi:hypothetical protein